MDKDKAKQAKDQKSKRAAVKFVKSAGSGQKFGESSAKEMKALLSGLGFKDILIIVD